MSGSGNWNPSQRRPAPRARAHRGKHDRLRIHGLPILGEAHQEQPALTVFVEVLPDTA